MSADPTPKATTERHAHGTAARYNHGPAGDGADPCRCPRCRRAVLAAREARRATRRPAHVDAAPTREHLEELRRHGLSVVRIAHRAGLNYRTVANILYGQPCDGRPPPARVRPATAHKLLAVAVPTRDVGWCRPADRAVGRLRALVARGWSVRLLATHLEIDHTHLCKLINGHKTVVTAATELAVIRLHKTLWSQQPPQGDRYERAAVTRSLQRAQAQGWSLPTRERGAA